MSHSLAARIYAEQLRMHGHGEPLWQPEPSSEDGDVRIGDVGFIEDGRFYRLFNARLPANHPINAVDGVPDGFVPLEYYERALLQKNDDYLTPTPLYSKSVSGTKVEAGGGVNGAYASYRFACRSEKGAVLLPGDSITLSHVQRNKSFPEYVRRNHDSWHQFALAQGRIIEAEDIVLVTGFLKTSEWALAAISNHGKAHGVSFSVQGAHVAQAEFAFEHSDAVEMSVSQRSGPRRNSRLAQSPRDQCLFLKYYKAKRNLLFMRKISANAEPQDEEGDMGRAWMEGVCDSMLGTTRGISDLQLTLEEVPSSVPLNDPLDHVLNYILEKQPSAEMAIVGHDEVHDLWRDIETWPDDFQTFLMESEPDVYLDENSVGYLSRPKPRPLPVPPTGTDPGSAASTAPRSPPAIRSPSIPLPTPNPVPDRGSYIPPPSSQPPREPGRRVTVPSRDHHERRPSYSDSSTLEPDARSLYSTASSARRYSTASSARRYSTASSTLYPPSSSEATAVAWSPTQRTSIQPPTPAVLMHWQLLPPNPAREKYIEFDMAFSVRRILKFTRAGMETFTQSDRKKWAADNARLTMMVIRCPELSRYGWQLTVEKPNGITCGDVLEELYKSMNTALTEKEYEAYVAEKERMEVEDAFAERCEVLAARGKEVRGEVKRWIDLLHGRRFFAGLKGGKDVVWELQVARPIFQ